MSETQGVWGRSGVLWRADFNWSGSDDGLCAAGDAGRTSPEGNRRTTSRRVTSRSVGAYWRRPRTPAARCLYLTDCRSKHHQGVRRPSVRRDNLFCSLFEVERNLQVRDSRRTDIHVGIGVVDTLRRADSMCAGSKFTRSIADL